MKYLAIGSWIACVHCLLIKSTVQLLCRFDDGASRWPAAYPLHSLTAKSVCEDLLNQFAIAGVSSIICYDNASNFEGYLTP